MDPLNIPIGTNLTNVPTHLGSYVSSIVGAALMVAALATFIFLVWGGIQWITAGGDKGKIEEARNRITGAIIGLAVTAAAWAIFLLVDHFLGLNMAGGTGSSSGSSTTSNSRRQGVCITADRCANGAVGTNFYCQNSSYTARTFGSCGTSMVYCDCVPR